MTCSNSPIDFVQFYRQIRPITMLIPPGIWIIEYNGNIKNLANELGFFSHGISSRISAYQLFLIE